MFTVALQPKSLASHLRFSQFSKDAQCFLPPRDTKMTHQAILVRAERNMSGVWDQDAMPKLTRGVEPNNEVGM
jgi:hypothetical protein